MKVKLNLKYLKGPAMLVLGQYSNNRIALRIVASGEPIAIASVNMPDFFCPTNHVWIKSYSENEGMMETLQENKVIGPVIKTANTGFVQVTLHEVLPKALEILKNS